MYAAQFDALTRKAYELFCRATEGDLKGTDSLYRFKKRRGTSDVDIVPITPKHGRKSHSSGKARHCITAHMRAQVGVYGRENVVDAVKAIEALPDAFDAKEAHLALRSLSREEKRAWLKSTAARLMQCAQSLREDPLSLDRIDRPGAAVHGMHEQVERALAHWWRVFDAELGPAVPQGEGATSAVQRLWDPLFEAHVGSCEQTAAVTPRSLRQTVINAPYLAIYERHDELVAHVTKVRGKRGDFDLNQHTLDLCDRVIESVTSCIALWALVAQRLELVSTATPGSCTALQGQDLPERHREIFLHLACCLVDRGCVVLDLQEGPMKILRYALKCRAAAQLWAERVTAHTAMQALLARIGQLPQEAPVQVPDASELERAGLAYDQACERLTLAEQAFGEAFLPGGGQAPFADDSAQAAALRRLQWVFERSELTAQVQVPDPLHKLLRQPLRELKARVAAYENLLEEHKRVGPSADLAREMREACAAIVALYPRLAARLATAVQALVDAAAEEGLSELQQRALVGLARGLAAVAQAVMDPHSSLRAFYAQARQQLADWPLQRPAKASDAERVPADSSSEEHSF